MNKTETPPRIRVTATRSPGKGAPAEGRVEIDNLTHDEVEKVEGMVNAGTHWFRISRRGRAIFHPAKEPLPSPSRDDEMLPFWRKLNPGEVPQVEIFQPSDEEDRLRYDSPTFIIQHLCGYYYTPESYRREAEKLERWGFQCLRSRRGSDGKYWEMWILHLFDAKGKLAELIDGKKFYDKEVIDRIVSFLCRNASFGSLDLATQRAAMVAD